MNSDRTRYNKGSLSKMAFCLLVISYYSGLVSSSAEAQPSILHRLQNARIAAVAILQEQTLKGLNSLVPNFAQQVRTTKKSLESALSYINSLMARLAISEKMSLAEAQAHSQYLQAEIRKLEEGQQSSEAPINTGLASLTSDQIRKGVQAGRINPTDLTNQQIEDAYGTAQKVD